MEVWMFVRGSLPAVEWLIWVDFVATNSVWQVTVTWKLQCFIYFTLANSCCICILQNCVRHQMKRFYSGILISGAAFTYKYPGNVEGWGRITKHNIDILWVRQKWITVVFNEQKSELLFRYTFYLSTFHLSNSIYYRCILLRLLHVFLYQSFL